MTDWVARVHVSLKPSVLDPQGAAVARSLHALGYDDVVQVRVGKLIEVEVAATTRTVAEQRIDSMCEQLLANTVIESYTVDLVEKSALQFDTAALQPAMTVA